jgi:hypothetical protein
MKGNWNKSPQQSWPVIQFKEKRAITLAEHEAIIKRETNRERRDFYELLWHTGASQTDAACWVGGIGSGSWFASCSIFFAEENWKTGGVAMS